MLADDIAAPWQLLTTPHLWRFTVFVNSLRGVVHYFLIIKQPRPKLLFNYPGSSSSLLPTADMQRAMLETLSYTDGASIKRAPSICNVPKQRWRTSFFKKNVFKKTTRTGLLQKQQSAAFMLTMASRTRRSTTICMLLEHTVDAAHMPPR